MNGSCHCGAVRLTVPKPPTEATQCGCSICRRYAGLWAYYPVGEVTISGPTDSYVWGRRGIEYRRCAECGCVVAWTPRVAYPECGVNVRMLEGLDLAAVTVIVEDDASM